MLKGKGRWLLLMFVLVIPAVSGAKNELCNYGIDKDDTYYIGETVIFQFECPYHYDKSYIVKWMNVQGGLLKEETGTIQKETVHNATYELTEEEFGVVELHIPNYDILYQKTYKVVDREKYLFIDNGDKVYRIPNLGRFIAGDKTPEIFGWLIVIALVWFMWSILLSGPDLITNIIQIIKRYLK